MLLDTTFDPFTTKTLTDIPGVTDDTSTAWPGFRFEPKPRNELLTLAEPPCFEPPNFQPEILRLDVADLPTVRPEPSTQTSPETSDHEGVRSKAGSDFGDGVDDIWDLLDVSSRRRESGLVSWDHFTNVEHREPDCMFVTEAGPHAFDLILRKCLSDNNDDEVKYAKSNVLLNALFDLSLGRGSVIFSWNEQSQRFETCIENWTMSGLSYDILREIINQFLDAGTKFRKLRTWGQSSAQQSTARMALQTVATSVVDAIEETVERHRASMQSLIQLQEIVCKSFTLLDIFDRLIKNVRSAVDDADLVSAVVNSTDVLSSEQPQFESVMHLIISRVLQPVLYGIEHDLGIAQPNEICQMDVDLLVSKIVSPPMVDLYAQARKTLHIVCSPGTSLPFDTRRVSCSLLSLAFSLDNLSALQVKADDYERQVQDFVVNKSIPRLIPLHTDNMNDSRHERHSQEDPFSLDQGVFDAESLQKAELDIFNRSEHVSLKRAIANVLVTDHEVSVDIVLSARQAIELSVGPMLRAQCRLLSYSALQGLFQDHNLVKHMALFGQFQLLRDGTFSSKFSLALFDSDQLSGEGRLLAPTRTGLRLQSRQTWPPATSELRLALMGILAESMPADENNELTDSISFAIRDLADEELERCRDIDSIYALDFLRLRYKPPNAYLEAIISQQSLDGYDNIFNQLLRLLRMKVLAQSLLRKGSVQSTRRPATTRFHKFKVEIQQFIAALGDYYQNAVINSTWHSFETNLVQTQERIRAKDYSGTLQLAGGLDQLRKLHEDTLDKITRGLLLKRKQSQAKGLIDRLFEVILRFAALSGRPTASITDEHEHDGAMMSARLHADFEMHVKALVRWLKLEVAKPGAEGTDMFEQLLLRLDWNGYWSR